MKKVVTTLTALSLVLGLALSGMAQSTASKETKAAGQTQVQTQTPAATSQATSEEKPKAEEAVKPQTKEGNKVKGKGTTQKSDKPGEQKPATSGSASKAEEKKEQTK